jgi:hypothetical protein
MSGLAQLRKQAQAVMKRLQRAGQRQLVMIEQQIGKLNKQRQALLNEITAAMGEAAGRGRG